MQANPFGNAKPVDTVAKLKELEERDAKRKVALPPLQYNECQLQTDVQCIVLRLVLFYLHQKFCKSRCSCMQIWLDSVLGRYTHGI